MAGQNGWTVSLTSVRWPLAQAQAVAAELVEALRPACERVEIAGSVRRRVADVKDIEIVAVPRFEERSGTDLWGSIARVDTLSEKLAELSAAGWLVPRAVEIHRQDGSIEWGRRVGDAYQALRARGVPVDLFIVRPPAEWGVIFAIRTGPGDWNQRLVTDCQRYFLRVANGRVWRMGKELPCPEEADFFAALGQPWVDPEHRHPSLVRVERPAR